MASRRKPLDDARKRLNEKLGAIDEQADFIQNSVAQITSGIRKTAQTLLSETNKTKFFSKYRTISQELEKCLDDLLLISATISSLDDQDEDDDEQDDDEEDNKNDETCSNKCHVEKKKEPGDHDKESPLAKEQHTLEVKAVQPLFTRENLCEIEAKKETSVSRENQVGERVQSDDVSQHRIPESHELQDILERKPCSAHVSNDIRPNNTVCSLEPDVANRELRATTENGNKTEFQKELLSRLTSREVKEEKEDKAYEIPRKLGKTEHFKFHLLGETNVTGPEKHQQSTKKSLSPVVVSQEKDGARVNKNTMSPTEILAGDVIEEALKSQYGDSINNVTSPSKKEVPVIPPFKFPEHSSLEIAVTEIISPVEFWIQQTNGDLDLLMEEMCIFFSKRAKVGDKGGMSHLPVLGQLCCGKCTNDDIWYRALVSAVLSESSTVEVLYVDEGNKECLPLSRLRPLDEKFHRLPCQALFCRLNGIQLTKDVNIEKVNDWFTRRVSGETLEAVLQEKQINTTPGTPVPIDLYIRPHGTATSSKIKHLKLEYNINEMMIREGLFQRMSSPKTSCNSVSPRSSSPSDNRSLTKADSVSTTTSGFHETPSDSPDPVQPADAPVRAHDTEQSTAVAKNQSCHGYEPRVPPPVIPLDYDGSLPMLVSHVVSPGEFYVHVISTEAGKLDILMEEMNQTYQERNLQHNQETNFSPRVGDFCCAKFSGDGNWYRAVILQIRHVANSTITFKVFYIDFGNIESVNVDDLQCLLPRFMDLPIQVIRCSLADIQPLVAAAELNDDVFATDSSSETRNVKQNKNPPRRSRSYPGRKPPRMTRRGYRPKGPDDDNAINIAAGDEEGEEDLLDPFIVIKEPQAHVRSRSTISEDIEKSHRRSSLMSDTAVELFEKVWSGVARPRAASAWPVEATEFFENLAKSASKLIGFVVPWDSKMVNEIMNYPQVGECSLPNLGPVLNLNLYDVSGDQDVFINGAMVMANLAVSPTINKEDQANSEITAEQKQENIPPTFPDVHVVKIKEKDLAIVAETLPDPKSSKSPSSPSSPTLDLLGAWNPMFSDYKSFRNAYNVDTDNVDVAITGYEEDRGKICRFYRTKYGCYQGDRCPHKHVQQDVSGKVCIFGGLSCAPTPLPDIGTWIAVRITAIYKPGHFWIQMPFGREPLDAQIIKSRSGKETSGEENIKDLDDLMKQMGECYSKTLRRERSLVPVTCGELVVLRYPKDKQWYRGKILDENDDEYEACFVDYGYSDWVQKDDVYPIIPQFLHLPFQAVECFLANVKPKAGEDNSAVSWSQEAEGPNKTMLVNLYSTVDDKDINIGQELTACGFAEDTHFEFNQAQNTNSVIELPG